jgi:hypothetical protein
MEDRGKYLVGVRGMRGAPMGKSVFRLLRDAKPDLENLMHQQDQKPIRGEALPFKRGGALGGEVK